MKYHCYEIHLNYYILENLFTSADNLAGNADMFRSRARGLHKKMWWNNCKVRETNHENYTIFNLLKIHIILSNKFHIFILPFIILQNVLQ